MQEQILTFQLKHITLAAIGFGNPQNPMILAIHGWLDNAESFRALATSIPNYYIVALELAGHGHSGHRGADAHYHLVDFVYDLHELVLKQSWSSLTLLGHSLGGIIASLYASCFNEHVERLICIESIGPFTQNAVKSAEQLKDSIESRLEIDHESSKPIRNVNHAIRARAIAGGFNEKVAACLMGRNVIEKNGQWFFRSDKRLRTHSSIVLTQEQAKAFITQIRCPVLVVTGEEGYQQIQQNVDDRIAWLSDVQHQVCPGHHHLHMDNARDVADKVIQFLEK